MNAFVNKSNGTRAFGRRIKHLPLFFFVFLFFAADACAGLKIYYLRHAQSGANVAHEWRMIPDSLRPSYVGNEDAFSPLGEAQVKTVPAKLEPYQFDFIAVSPKWRARQTILGYLKQSRRQAEIWPELEEFSMDMQMANQLISKDTFRPERPDLFAGEQIKITDEEKPFLKLREGQTSRFKLRSGADDQVEDWVHALDDAISRIKKLESAGDSSVLLVGHGNSGRMLLHRLVKNEGDLPQIANVGLWMAEEQPDGTFELKIYNDAPVASR